jgi:hypothetical protein
MRMEVRGRRNRLILSYLVYHERSWKEIDGILN